MENKLIKFDFELYNTGNYDIITEVGFNVLNLKKTNKFEDGVYRYTGAIFNRIFIWDLDGKLCYKMKGYDKDDFNLALRLRKGFCKVGNLIIKDLEEIKQHGKQN